MTAIDIAIHMVMSTVAQNMVTLMVVQNMVEGKNHIGSHVNMVVEDIQIDMLADFET